MSATGHGLTLHGRPARFPRGLTAVADGVHAWLEPNGDWSETNAGLVVGDGEAALIDTAWDLGHTEAILRAVRELTDAPLRTLVATHGDGDHVNGFQLVPEGRLWASTATAADIAHEDPAGMRRSKRGAQVLARVGVGPARRFGAYLSWMFGPFDFAGIRLRTPDETFADSTELDVGGQHLRLRRLGPAHTAGDTIVHLPDHGVVFAGDLLFNGVTPNSWSGGIDRWLRALDAIGDLAPRVVVGGHGPLGGVAELELLGRYWRWLRAACRAELRRGGSSFDIARRIVTGTEFAAEPWSGWACVERTVLNVEILRRELAGGPIRPIAHAERPRLMWQVAGLQRALSRRAGQPRDGLLR